MLIAAALAGCGAPEAAAPSSAMVRLTAPSPGTPVVQGRPVDIRGEYAGSGIAEVAVRVNGVEHAVVPAVAGATVVSAQWTPNALGQQVIYLEALDANRNVLARSDVVAVLVTIPTPTLAPTQPPPAMETPAAGTAAAPQAVEATSAPAATAPAATASVATPTSSSPGVTVSSDTANLRTGPGTGYPLAGRMIKGQLAQVIGRNDDGTWWQVDVDGESAWVFGELVQANPAAEGVAVAAAPPLPTPLPTEPPTATSVPTPAVPPTPVATPLPECNPSNPFWAATLNNAPDYTFCTPVPFEFVMNADPDPRQMVIRWHIYGDIKSLELRVDPNGSSCGIGDRGLRQQVNLKEDSFRLNRGDFPKGGYKIGLYATMNDGRIQDWGELNFCGEG
jgi:uncharacterized protein YraI